MIVKDEAATIQTTLASMRDHIDDWTIVDTGSTDGTQAGTPQPAPCLTPALTAWGFQAWDDHSARRPSFLASS